ncbi:MAG: HAD-IIIC family phosphatase [Acidobacteriia bacterium]|nr:HAD-IIIC family phosphatase [Terriglobia bacterium]
MTDPRVQIDEQIAAGRYGEASAALEALWREKPSMLSVSFVESRVRRMADRVPLTACRMFFLRSFTVEPLLPFFKTEALLAGIDVTAECGQFGAYTQESMDPESALYRFRPDVVFLAVHLRSVAPELWEGGEAPARDEVIERTAGAVRNCVEQVRQRCGAHIVIQNFDCPADAPDGLLGDQSGAFHLVRAANEALKAAAQATRGCYVLDYDRFTSTVGRGHLNDERKWLTTRLPVRAELIPALAREWARFLRPLTGKTCKVLATDLDNTLWRGVLGEDGADRLQMDAEYPGASYRAVQRALKDLVRRGVILAVVSKNNPDEAMAVLNHHPDMLLRSGDFSALRINWNDKPANLREIARELNVGLDSIAFLDDNPAERTRVRAELPEVKVIEWPGDALDAPRTIRECGLFERLWLSAEDRERQTLYAQQRERAELAGQAGSLEEFYFSLQQRVTFEPVNARTLQRAAQLTQKTNQFNLTTRRCSEQEIAALMDDPGWMMATASVVDRFGDNGITGLVMAKFEDGACRIETFLLSCRVIGRTVETAMLAAVEQICARRGAREIRGWFIPTPKNAPARGMYAAHGFECIEEVEGRELWSRAAANGKAAPAWIQLTIEEKLLTSDQLFASA